MIRVSVVALLWFAACGPKAISAKQDGGGSAIDASDGSTGCQSQCSTDLHSVVDCNGNVLMQCSATTACDTATLTCADPCTAAASDHRSVGCDYYATDMETEQPTYCFAVFVSNTWSTPAHIAVDYQGTSLTVASFARRPVGNGPSLTYAAYDATAGVAAGDVAVLFLAGGSGASPLCPAPPAAPDANLTGTGISDSFHITTDVPVVAYQINPYGGGTVAVTGASLLLPTSVWDTNYVAVNVSPASVGGDPSLNIIAAMDNTTVTFNPVAAVTAGSGIPGSGAAQPFTIQLNKGQNAQITQTDELTGSIVTSNNPVGFMAGHHCMNVPSNQSYCDHGEQMVPPVHALGSHYVGVMYRPRVTAEVATYWRVVGAVDGTELTYSSNVGGPATLSKGQAVTFLTGTPFTVASQDSDHPFMLFTYMTSSTYVEDGYGDPDFVISVPPEQYLSEYVFFADPTYPDTNLVVVRAPGLDGQFHDVTLDCLGVLTNWTAIGSYQWTRVDLISGNFQNVGNCSTGRHEIHSDATFGLWVWGWGTPGTSPDTANVSYGYPGGMNVAPINSIIIQ